MNWKEFLSKKKIEFIVTILILIVILLLFTNFLQHIEKSQGTTLEDPVLNIFSPIDLTWFTFSVIYISLITAMIRFLIKPELLLLALQSYTLLIIFRMVAMFTTHFEPPEGLILLNDPFVQLFGSGKILTKDLFFSGHTATLFLLFLIIDRNYLKYVFVICTFLVGVALLVQHVHYTIDVFAAPFFAYSSYRLIIIMHKKAQK
jgi:PAP2 superfamily C-terminal